MIIHNDRQELQKALQYVEEELKKYNLNRREATMTMLMAEESIVCMMSHTEEQEKIEIVFKKLFGNISLNKRCIRDRPTSCLICSASSLLPITPIKKSSAYRI